MSKTDIVHSYSFYQDRLEDDQAVYLTSENFEVKGDGQADDTSAIQAAINQVKDTFNFGIVFVPEGIYRISETIYIPKAVRLIGYGKKRPTFILGENTPGFQEEVPSDKGRANYMFWFTDTVPKEGEEVKDANAGTFYSALSNIDIKISKGNPSAVALRTHFAQHSFIAHVDIHIGDGKAGIFDVGNEIEDVRFFGGDYGIYTTKTSPAWPFMMVDTYFEGQRKAAIQSKEAGLTITRMVAKNTPTVIETTEGFYEKLYIEDSRFENISGPALVISNEHNSFTQVNVRNVSCSRVAMFAQFRESEKKVEGRITDYKVRTLTHGVCMEDIDAAADIQTIYDFKELDHFSLNIQSNIPSLPPMSTWVNIKTLGAIGDGECNDTEAIQKAIDTYRTIYLPQGCYVVNDTITLREDTVLIGLNPISTQIIVKDNTESFSGFGAPKPLLEAPKGGANIVFGIGLDTGARNTRAVGCKWMAGAESYMNDVKFMGGHGAMSKDLSYVPLYNDSRTADYNPDLRWDSQYWSLWVTNGGGGVFKDIWTASPYASAGLYVSHTDTPGYIYAMSVEHHVRNEVKFKDVENWQALALQFEEEAAESTNCLPLELQNCKNITFANLYFFRTIWLDTPYPYAMKTWDCESLELLNVHNFTQVKYTMDNVLFDVNTSTEVRPWQISRLFLSGKQNKTNKNRISERHDSFEKLAGGFEFVDAMCQDSKGNLFFVDSRLKRIYKWSAKEECLSLVTDIHHRPRSIACDEEDRLLVVVEYFPSKGATINGKPEVYSKTEDAKGSSYSFWYNTGSTIKVYSIDPNKPEESMQVLETRPLASVETVKKALYPANRWRDSGDFLTATVEEPQECYVAEDGVTIIPVTYDLMRACSLLEAYPEKHFYGVDEYYKRTVKYDVTANGLLTNPRILIEKGEFNVATDIKGNIYVPDGEIYVFNKDGEILKELKVPERPACILFSNQQENDLFLYMTARSSLYKTRISLANNKDNEE
ncbi:glycosyl hydrolase family 28-related protein [Evansella cellulosilytica]|uniref:SMP-30/Gluconolaconase/LRE-like region-containing protein n=1 Tax=Evansella cellulosilytica (strain ATCC 21833 / DSM 2522 / FERM P-1141 / JCM 9156 / N-4) TaxID=649639 RepID=E6TYC3_EVAC2|nr:glycosyl hydrolase family 28-related protein [Evansella cellulosilytica]ADU28861.1 SMP-30/Gluconolaconase/LRE-like region-containing protein [Evansella cellulosilytica DSM 2522]